MIPNCKFLEFSKFLIFRISLIGNFWNFTSQTFLEFSKSETFEISKSEIFGIFKIRNFWNLPNQKFKKNSNYKFLEFSKLAIAELFVHSIFLITHNFATSHICLLIKINFLNFDFLF